MSVSRLLCCGAFAALAGPAVAAADAWYLDLNAAASAMRDTTATLAGGGAASSGTLRIGSGTAWGGAVGRRFGDWRVEGEVSYRGNKLSGSSVPGIDANQSDADYAALFLMANVYYDFAPFAVAGLAMRPYVGVGLGRAQEVDSDLALGGVVQEFSGSRRAGQLAAGLRWDYASAWSAGVGLRYTDAGTVTLRGTGAATGQTLTARYRGVTLGATLGYRF